MLIDYHMHFEYGSYDEEWVKGFFESAKKNKVEEIGISEHSHGFTEFKELYYKELDLRPNTLVGDFQEKWLAKNKFKCSINDYENFINTLKAKSYPVKFAIEVCNFQDQESVEEILKKHNFDYIIASVHFIDGWGFDASLIKENFSNYNLMDLYEKYTIEIEKLANTKLYDILGHPFNIRVFGNIPSENIDHLLERAVIALKNSNMAIDINTGSKYRYPIREISPFNRFMYFAQKYDLDIVLSSDAHKPEDCGKYIEEASEYAKSFGFEYLTVFNQRQREKILLK